MCFNCKQQNSESYQNFCLWKIQIEECKKSHFHVLRILFVHWTLVGTHIVLGLLWEIWFISWQSLDMFQCDMWLHLGQQKDSLPEMSAQRVSPKRTAFVTVKMILVQFCIVSNKASLSTPDNCHDRLTETVKYLILFQKYITMAIYQIHNDLIGV